MKISTRLQLLTCLVVYVSCAHAIMVKFGTKGGPIEPPPPESTLPPPQQYRTPAPVWDWEERSHDAPDPNAQWRPQLFVPQTRYTHVDYNTPSKPEPINNAQRFVNSYKLDDTPRPIKEEDPKNYFTPAQFLSSQRIPGYGLRYFVPAYLNDLQQRKGNLKQEDAKHNQIETNEVDAESKESANDAQWKYEKESSKRTYRHTDTLVASPIVYQWPVFVPHQ